MRRLISSREGRTTYSIFYKARVVDIKDETYQGLIKVYIAELNHQEPIEAYPLRTNLGSFSIPEVNSTVYVLLDQENPNVCYYIGNITEYHSKPDILPYDEYVLSLPILQEKIYALDSNIEQDRWFIQFHSVYSNELWWKIPNRLAYKNYTDHEYKTSKEQNLFEGKIVRIRQSLDKFYGNNKESHRKIFLLPGTGQDERVYKDKTKIFNNKIEDQISFLELLIGSYKHGEYKNQVKFARFDKSLLDDYDTLYKKHVIVEDCLLNWLEHAETKSTSGYISLFTFNVAQDCTSSNFNLHNNYTGSQNSGFVIDSIVNDNNSLTQISTYFNNNTTLIYLYSDTSSSMSNYVNSSGSSTSNLQMYNDSSISYTSYTVSLGGGTSSITMQSDGSNAIININAQSGQVVQILFNSASGTLTINAQTQVNVNTQTVQVNAQNINMTASTSFTINAQTLQLNAQNTIFGGNNITYSVDNFIVNATSSFVVNAGIIQLN